MLTVFLSGLAIASEANIYTTEENVAQSSSAKKKYGGATFRILAFEQLTLSP